jgi:hypothetical protein
MEYTELCKLAEKHLTDKGPRFHGYTKHYYEAIMKYMDPNTVTTVGEIGIGYIDCMCHVSDAYTPGASLRMWRDFFPAATIYGFDNHRPTLFQETRITCKYMDQSSIHSIYEALGSCGNKFDILVDDGSHIIEHQLLTKTEASKYVKEGGLLIIEDIDTRYVEYWFTEPPEGFELVYITEDSPWDAFVIYRRKGLNK